MLSKTLVDKISEQYVSKYDYGFSILKVQKDRFNYLVVVYGDFSDQLNDFDTWKKVHEAPYIGPRDWADDLYLTFKNEAMYMQINQDWTHLPLYLVSGLDELIQVLDYRLETFNDCYTKITYATQ